MFLRPNHRSKDGKDHTYWSLGETVRTADGPRQKTLCYLGELNSSAQARWLRTNDTRLYRRVDRILPYKTKLERHLKQRYGELFGAEFDVLLYDLTSTYGEGAASVGERSLRGLFAGHGGRRPFVVADERRPQDLARAAGPGLIATRFVFRRK
jgi:hypothetical protein